MFIDKKPKNILFAGPKSAGKTWLIKTVLQINSESSSISLAEEITINNGKYLLIDTPRVMGISPSSLETFTRLVKAFEKTNERGGVHEIMLVIGGRSSYHSLKEVVILLKLLTNGQFYDYTTIVRNNFIFFEDEEKCQEELAEMRDTKNLSENLKTEVDNLFSKLPMVFVDNPPLSERELMETVNKETREKSRQILIDHWANETSNCQMPKLIDLSNLEKIKKEFFYQWPEQKERASRRKSIILFFFIGSIILMKVFFVIIVIKKRKKKMSKKIITAGKISKKTGAVIIGKS